MTVGAFIEGKWHVVKPSSVPLPERETECGIKFNPAPTPIVAGGDFKTLTTGDTPYNQGCDYCLTTLQVNEEG